MNRDEASEILELSPHASPAERSAQYDTLRRQLEDKLAKAPTPGLRDKYRNNLKQLEEAVAVLAQTDDATSLPVTSKQSPGGPVSVPAASAPVGPPLAGVPGLGNPKSKIQNRKSGTEFLVVAAIAVALLGAGGWWVMKTRAENAAQARLAAEAKATADREAAAAKAEAERQANAEKTRLEQVKVQLRTALAEAKIAWDVAEREERDAERRASDLRSELRGLRDPKPDVAAGLNLRLESAQRYSAWLRDYLLRHPLKVARAKLEELLQGGALAEAGTAGDEVRRLMEVLQADLARHPGGEAAVRIDTVLPTVEWELSGPGGSRERGAGPARVTGLLFARYTVSFLHPSFPKNIERPVSLEPGRDEEFACPADFVRFTIKGLQEGDRVEIEGKEVLPLPDGSFPCLRDLPGGHTWLIRRDGHLPWEYWNSASDKDFTAEFVAVPLHSRPLVDAALKTIAGLPPRLRVGPLVRLIAAGDVNQLIGLDETNRLLKDTLHAIDAEPPSQFAEFAATDPQDRLRARLPLIESLVSSDPAAAQTLISESVAVVRKLPDRDKLRIAIPMGTWGSQREAMLEYAGVMQAALESQPEWFKEAGYLTWSYQLFGLLHLHGEPAKAEAWKTKVAGFRGSATRVEDERSFAFWKAELEAFRDSVNMCAALMRRDQAEFNRASQARSADFSPPAHTIYDLLAHGAEKQAVDVAVSLNSNNLHGTIYDYATLNGRLGVLEDFQTRSRTRTRSQELLLAELYALAGNTAKARNWLEKTEEGRDLRETRIFTLAQMGDLAAARKAFDDLEKSGFTFNRLNRSLLPYLVAACRLLADPAREQRILDLAGEKTFQLDAGWLARIGDVKGAVDQARSARQSVGVLRNLYRFANLRAKSAGDLPWIGGDENKVALIVALLHRLNPPQRTTLTLDLPYARKVPPTFRESVVVPNLPGLRGSGPAGETKIAIDVDATGRATGYRALSGSHPAFAEAMFKAAAEKGFHPAMENGRPVAGTCEMTRVLY